jgi:hypothetical protein
MPQQRQDEVTPLQPAPLACALAVAWKALWGAPPARDAVLTLLAQIRHETGFHYCHANNLGNFKSVPGDGRDWVVFQTWERNAQGAKVAMQARFRAYPSLEAGATDYLASLKTRYGNAWPFVEAGDPAGFVHALKARGYFTDIESTYAADVVRAFHLYRDTIQFDCDPPVPPTLAETLAVAQSQQFDLSAEVDWQGRQTDPAPPMPDDPRNEVTRPDVAVLPKDPDEV